MFVVCYYQSRVKDQNLNINDAYFPFVKRPLLFLTDDTATGNQAFSHKRRNIFPGLSYHKASNTVLNSLKKNDVEAQVVEFMFKVMERARVTCY